jgi:hypothetical protein
VGIAFGDDHDEYAPEAGIIAPRLTGARTVEDVVAVVHEEFVGWFDAGIAGPPARYRVIAEEIWPLLRT